MRVVEENYKALLVFAQQVVRAKKISLHPVDLVNEVYLKLNQSTEQLTVKDIKALINKRGWEEKTYSTVRKNYTHGQLKHQTGVIENDRACKECGEVKPLMAFRDRDDDGIPYHLYTCKECESSIAAERYRRTHPPKNRIKKAKIVKPKKEKLPKPVLVEKECNKCKKLLLIESFQVVHRRPGYDYIYPTCKKCINVSKNKWYKKNKKKWNKYVTNRRNKDKPAKVEKSIQTLWREANRRYQAKQKEKLSDVYISGLLKGSSIIPTPQLIEEKRMQLIEKRKNAPPKNKIIKVVEAFDFEALIKKQKERESGPYIFKTHFPDIKY